MVKKTDKEILKALDELDYELISSNLTRVIARREKQKAERILGRSLRLNEELYKKAKSIGAKKRDSKPETDMKIFMGVYEELQKMDEKGLVPTLATASSEYFISNEYTKLKRDHNLKYDEGTIRNVYAEVENRLAEHLEKKFGKKYLKVLPKRKRIKQYIYY